jgi:hypothetical protein
MLLCVTWTVSDDEALASVAPALEANRRVALGSLALAVAIPVVAIGLLYAGVTAPRLTVSGSGGEWSTTTHRGEFTGQVTNDGRRPVTVTGVAMFEGDGTPLRGLSELVVTPTAIPAGETVDVRYTFLVDCSAFPAAPQDGVAFTSGPIPYSEITVTGTWPWRTTQTNLAGLGVYSLSTYCTPPS